MTATLVGGAPPEHDAAIYDTSAVSTLDLHCNDATEDALLSGVVECSCCGEVRDPTTMAALSCRDDVRVCRGCIGSLSGKVGLLDVTPTLPVVDMQQSQDFYEAAGFDVDVYEGGGFAFVRHDDQSVFDLGLESDMIPAANKAGCYVTLPVPDEWHALFTDLGYPVTELRDEDYGMREFTLTDPSGNNLRFGNPI